MRLFFATLDILPVLQDYYFAFLPEAKNGKGVMLVYGLCESR